MEIDEAQDQKYSLLALERYFLGEKTVYRIRISIVAYSICSQVGD
jgi:hypothetical protein